MPTATLPVLTETSRNTYAIQPRRRQTGPLDEPTTTVDFAEWVAPILEAKQHRKPLVLLRKIVTTGLCACQRKVYKRRDDRPMGWPTWHLDFRNSDGSPRAMTHPIHRECGTVLDLRHLWSKDHHLGGYTAGAD